LTEYELQRWILDRFGAEELHTEKPPIVAVGANAANPHYEPHARGSATIAPGSVLLVDLWARERDGIYADQTWMGVLGTPTPRAVTIWETIRDARDAAIRAIRDGLATGEGIRGADADDAARAVVTERGFGEYFTHRTGHSIDAMDLHGAGPHLDNLETREERYLIPGVGFSIEPGVYIEGEIGMRTEVNAYVSGKELLVTPVQPQRDLMVV
jgi:Xaa-Pro dipeptidase